MSAQDRAIRAFPERLHSRAPAPPPWFFERLLQSYLMWRTRSDEVALAYERWTVAPASERGAAFEAYRSALEREERAARVHQQYARRIGAAAPQGVG